MVAITTYGQYLRTVSQIKAGQTSIIDLGRQLASGRKADDISAYGTQGARVVDLRAFIARRENYLKSIDMVETRLKAYDATLNGIDRATRGLEKLLSEADTFQQAADSGLDGQIAILMKDVRFYLNQEMGDRYLFAGARYGTEPVADLESLAAPAAAVPPPLVANPTLTDYDTQSPGSDANAWSEERFSADDGLVVQYGINAQNPGFQDLVMALRYAKAAANDQVNFGTYMAGARQLIASAVKELRAVRNEVAVDQGTIGNARQFHKTSLDLLLTEQSTIEGVDLAEVGTKINVLQTQIEASYAVTRILGELSLVNFLR
jgi:flagellar hook-associated protein 3 FlgL